MSASDETQGPPSGDHRDDPATERGDRIAKLLARAGVASRREIERMIADGRIALHGEAITTPATLLTSLRGVTVDGKPVARPERTRLFRFHKPGGLLTAERDPAGRPTIYTALRNALPPGTPRMMPIGRLDLNTEGLLLMTNDGEFKRLLELPANGVPRTYRARTFGEISQAQLEELIEGVTIDGVHYGRIDANLERRTGRNQWIELTLTEGKNREVRRVLEHLGLQVSRLLRTTYGPFPLGDLPRGAAAEVPREALERFASSLKRGVGGEMPMLEGLARSDTPPPRATKPAEEPMEARRAPARPARGDKRPAPGASGRTRRESQPDRRENTRDSDRPKRFGSAPARGERPTRASADNPRREGSTDRRANAGERAGSKRFTSAPERGERPSRSGPGNPRREGSANRRETAGEGAGSKRFSSGKPRAGSGAASADRKHARPREEGAQDRGKPRGPRKPESSGKPRGPSKPRGPGRPRS